MQRCQQLDFRFLASRTVFQVPPVYGPLLWQPLEMNTLRIQGRHPGCWGSMSVWAEQRVGSKSGLELVQRLLVGSHQQSRMELFNSEVLGEIKVMGHYSSSSSALVRAPLPLNYLLNK